MSNNRWSWELTVEAEFILPEGRSFCSAATTPHNKRPDAYFQVLSGLSNKVILHADRGSVNSNPTDPRDAHFQVPEKFAEAFLGTRSFGEADWVVVNSSCSQNMVVLLGFERPSPRLTRRLASSRPLRLSCK